jgi:hypothetical protein
MKMERTGIVIVNYNSADLALKAIASVLAARRPGRHLQIVLVDNASPELGFDALVQRVTQKFPDHTVAVRTADMLSASNAEIVLIASPENGGFAAGCNIGIRFLQAMNTNLFVLLNPDTLIHRDALTAFRDKLSDTSYGLVGATLLTTGKPARVQALGGAMMSAMTLLGKNLGEGEPLSVHQQETYLEASLDYPVGAAMAFRADWLEEAGLMDERYFLYYEEADWVRAGRKKYKPGWASGARVFHYRGAVAGSHLGVGQRSPLADYHMVRSRMLFAKKWCPWMLPLLFALGLVQALRRVVRQQWQQAGSVLRGNLPFAPRMF